jgi:hypothetical protein
MALRFHGSEGGVIDSKRLVKSLHYMLERPELADLVIPDLAKWEDWTVMDRLFSLYKSADEKNSWVRVPVVNYLRACPLPKAKELLKECEKIDPAAVKRANTFFPGAPSEPTPSADKASQLAPPAPGTGIAADAIAAGGNETLPATSAEGAALAMRGGKATRKHGQETTLAAADAGGAMAAALNEGVTPAAASRKTAASPPNLWTLLGVPWGMCAVLFFVQWSLLRGGAR